MIYFVSHPMHTGKEHTFTDAGAVLHTREFRQAGSPCCCLTVGCRLTDREAGLSLAVHWLKPLFHSVGSIPIPDLGNKNPHTKRERNGTVGQKSTQNRASGAGTRRILRMLWVLSVLTTSSQNILRIPWCTCHSSIPTSTGSNFLSSPFDHRERSLNS